MKEFFQAVLISVALTFPIFFMSNGMSLSPKSANPPAMDPNMPGMNHSAPTAAPVVNESMPHSH